jgi:cytochrome c oxidase assembly protein subunit 19
MNAQTRAAREGAGTAPQRGSFPIDHLHECDGTIFDYYTCLKKNKYFAQKCRVEVKAYLDCRLEKGLMTKDDYRAANLPDPNAPIANVDIEDIKRRRRELRNREHVGFKSRLEDRS